jgi:hypothetical protein
VIFTYPFLFKFEVKKLKEVIDDVEKNVFCWLCFFDFSIWGFEIHRRRSFKMLRLKKIRV